jgi:hypothetical protein
LPAGQVGIPAPFSRLIGVKPNYFPARTLGVATFAKTNFFIKAVAAIRLDSGTFHGTPPKVKRDMNSA